MSRTIQPPKNMNAEHYEAVRWSVNRSRQSITQQTNALSGILLYDEILLLLAHSDINQLETITSAR